MGAPDVSEDVKTSISKKDGEPVSETIQESDCCGEAGCCQEEPDCCGKGKE